MQQITISPHQLADLYHAHENIDVIDVRTPVEFREVHLPNARNIPLDQLEPAAVMETRNGTGGQPLYVVCQSGSRGEKAREMFRRAGFDNVVNVDGGTAACERANLPLVRGRKAVSLERQVRIAAGALVLLGVVLGWTIQPALSGLSALVGAGLIFAGVTDTCGMGLLLARMPWNRCENTGGTCEAD